MNALCVENRWLLDATVASPKHHFPLPFSMKILSLVYYTDKPVLAVPHTTAPAKMPQVGKQQAYTELFENYFFFSSHPTALNLVKIDTKSSYLVLDVLYKRITLVRCNLHTTLRQTMTL